MRSIGGAGPPIPSDLLKGHCVEAAERAVSVEAACSRQPMALTTASALCRAGRLAQPIVADR